MDTADNAGLVTEEVLQNEYVTILFNKADSMIIIKWKRQIDFDERVATFLWACDYSVQHSVKNWLIDDEEIYVITTRERDWVENIFTKKAAEANLEKIAVWTPDHYNSLATLTDFTEQARQNYLQHGHTQHAVFTDFQTALTWLRSDTDQE